jgi:predicted dehydrogenase
VKEIGNADLVAICDVYEPHRETAKAKHAANAQGYGEYREVLDRKEIDAVLIGTPDRWHVPITIAAARAGKDIYCEKPVTHRPEEADSLLAAIRETKRVVQTGTQQRNWAHFIQAKELIQSGELGQVTLIRTYWYQNHIPSQDHPAVIETEKLDWKTFLGSQKDRPFDSDQYANWRWYCDFSDGAMTDLFVHWVDVAHWYMGKDTPLRATATGTKAILKERETLDTMSAPLLYPGDVIVEFDCALLGYLEGGGLMICGGAVFLSITRFRVTRRGRIQVGRAWR